MINLDALGFYAGILTGYCMNCRFNWKGETLCACNKWDDELAKLKYADPAKYEKCFDENKPHKIKR